MRFLSLIFTILLLVFPGYKIKKLLPLTMEKRIMYNLIGCAVSYYIGINFLIFYLYYFTLTEVMYSVFDEYHPLDIFDKISIASIIMSTLAFYLVYTHRDFLMSSLDIDGAISNLERMSNLSRDDVIIQLERIKESFLALVIFPCIFITNIFIYALNEKKQYREWELSHPWIFICGILFLFREFLFQNNFLVTNGFEMVKFIFTVYGIKSLYKILCQGFQPRKNAFFNIILIFVALRIPMFFFTLGIISNFSKNFFNKKNFKGD